MGFFEILLIAVVALLVVGPERMPEAVRSAALAFGKVKRSLSSARSEIEKQIGMDDIRRQIHNEDVMDNLSKIKAGLSDIDRQIDLGEVAMPYDQDAYDNLHNQAEVALPDRDQEPVVCEDAADQSAQTNINQSPPGGVAV